MLALKQFANIDELTNWCIDHLIRQGFIVTPDSSDWETPGQLRARVCPRMPAATFTQRLHGPETPNYRAIRGPSGRILKLRANAQLEAHLTR